MRERDPCLMTIPVLVVDLRHNAAATYRLGAYELAGYWKSIPTTDELVGAILAALRHRDAAPAPGGIESLLNDPPR